MIRSAVVCKSSSWFLKGPDRQTKWKYDRDDHPLGCSCGINSTIIPRFPLDEIQVLIYYLNLIERGQFQRLSLGLPHMRTQGQGPNWGLLQLPNIYTPSYALRVWGNDHWVGLWTQGPIVSWMLPRTLLIT